MTIVQAWWLGLIQGLTEYLPVSSSGHLVLISHLLKWEEPGTMFAIAVHLGTLLAVVIYFWREWKEIFRGQKKEMRASLLAATVVTIGLALVITQWREDIIEPSLVATMLAIFGLILWWADARSQKNDQVTPTMGQSLVLGAAQAVALVPGVSRSGILITVGRLFRLERAQAARYAFLLSAPIIALSPLSLLTELVPGDRFDITVVVGFIAAAISGWVAIASFMKLLNKISYGWFAFYRIGLALIIWFTIN